MDGGTASAYCARDTKEGPLLAQKGLLAPFEKLGRFIAAAWLKLAHDNRENVACREHEVVLVVVLDLGATVLGVDDPVADADVERHAVAVVVDATGADRHDLALLGLLLGGVRNDKT